jgi:NAD(P)-dependent dehydrogenase (short-subunit alcohol dehydrogenase family)
VSASHAAEPLAGRVVAVTGGARGIAAAIADQVRDTDHAARREYEARAVERD